MPRMNALARLRPGSSDCLPAGVARQRKGTKRIMAPAAQGPRPSAVQLPRHAAIPFAPCTGADAETPLTTSQLFTGALDQRGEGTKNRGFRTQSRPDRILPTAGRKDLRAAFPGHGLHRPPGACVAAGIAFNASPPAKIVVIDHLAGHAAVDADVFARDEPRLVGCEIQHHVGDVQRMPHAPRGMLGCVRSLVAGEGRVNPAGRDGIDPHPSDQTHGKGVRQRRDAAFGCGIALRLRLAHAVTRRGNVDDGRAGRKTGRKQLCQVERSRHAHAQRLIEFLIGARIQPAREGQGVVDQHVHPPVIRDHLRRKGFQRRLVAHVAHEIIIWQQVDHAYVRAGLFEFLRDDLADALRAACDHRHSILKHHAVLPLRRVRRRAHRAACARR